jgi:hypothetical protein
VALTYHPTQSFSRMDVRIPLFDAPLRCNEAATIGQKSFPCLPRSREISSLRATASSNGSLKRIDKAGFSVVLGLVKLNALAANAIGHSLMEISAMLANPDRRNSAGKAMLAMTKVPAFFGLFAHVSPLQ